MHKRGAPTSLSNADDDGSRAARKLTGLGFLGKAEGVRREKETGVWVSRVGLSVLGFWECHDILTGLRVFNGSDVQTDIRAKLFEFLGFLF